MSFYTVLWVVIPIALIFGVIFYLSFSYIPLKRCPTCSHKMNGRRIYVGAIPDAFNYIKEYTCPSCGQVWEDR